MIIAKESYEDMLETIKSCATIKDPRLAEYNICAMNKMDENVSMNHTQIYILTSSGNYMWYSLDITSESANLLKDALIFDAISEYKL